MHRGTWELLPKKRKFTVIERAKQERMEVKGEGIRNIFLELTTEMHFEDMIGKHTDCRYSYSYRFKIRQSFREKIRFRYILVVTEFIYLNEQLDNK